MLKLNIPKISTDKIYYYLKTFPDNEWSGPAWYKYTKNKNGFPANWTLVHFEPIHLGGSAETEYSGSDLNKAVLTTIAKYPEFKKYYIGLIHSHHSMKAYFSNTDQSQLIENANNSGYPSLVVSSASPYAFAISYFDQFSIPHIIEASKVATTIAVSNEWKTQANLLKTNRSKTIKKLSKRKLWTANKWKDKRQTTLPGNSFDDNFKDDTYYGDFNDEKSLKNGWGY
jgi:hypothetical protein